MEGEQQGLANWAGNCRRSWEHSTHIRVLDHQITFLRHPTTLTLHSHEAPYHCLSQLCDLMCQTQLWQAWQSWLKWRPPEAVGQLSWMPPGMTSYQEPCWKAVLPLFTVLHALSLLQDLMHKVHLMLRLHLTSKQRSFSEAEILAHLKKK